MPKRPSHATVVAYLALFIAVGGTSYAAATIGSAQIKDHSVRGKDIRTGTIGGREVKESALEGVAGLDTYEVTAKQPTVFPGAATSGQATCKLRDRVVGGGVQLNVNDPDAQITRSAPFGPRSWSALVNVPSATAGSRPIEVYAICLRRPR